MNANKKQYVFKSFMVPREPVHQRLQNEDLRPIFQVLDENGDGRISQIEFIKTCRHRPDIAEKLGLPSHFMQESRSRDILQLTFNEICRDGSKTFNYEKFLNYYCPPEVSPAEVSFEIPETPVTPVQPTQRPQATAHRTASPPVSVPLVDRNETDGRAKFGRLQSLGGSFKTLPDGQPAYQDFELDSPRRNPGSAAAQIYHAPSGKFAENAVRASAPIPPSDPAFSAPENQQHHYSPPFSQPVPIEQMHFDTPGFPGHLDPSEVEAEKGLSQIPMPQVKLPVLRPGGPWRPLSTEENRFGQPQDAVPVEFSRAPSGASIESLAFDQKREREAYMHQHGIQSTGGAPKTHQHPFYEQLADSLFKPSKPQSNIVQEHSHNDFLTSINRGFKQLVTAATCADNNRKEEYEKSEKYVLQQRPQTRIYAYARC